MRVWHSILHDIGNRGWWRSVRQMTTGIAHHKAKTPAHIIAEARHLRERHGYTYRELAEVFGVSKWTIRDWVDLRTRVYE